ncbi:MAG: pyridoxamine 5'-phosphate oxidase family protein [Frankia sp.]
MTDWPKTHRHLLEAPGIAVLSTVGRGGHPQVTAVGYFLDDDGQLKLSLNTTRHKTKNLIADPKATLFFVDPASVYRTLEVRAEVELLPDEEFAFAAKAGGHYGTDFRVHDRPGETRVIAVFHPVKVNALDMTG